MTFMLADYFGFHQDPREEDAEGVAKSAGHGEGSRGGKILGHTASGKAIYANNPTAHIGFSRKDHLAARDAHLEEAQKHSKMLSRLKRHGADEYDKDFQHVDNALVHHVQMSIHHLSEAGGLPVKKQRPACP